MTIIFFLELFNEKIRGKIFGLISRHNVIGSHECARLEHYTETQIHVFMRTYQSSTVNADIRHNI